MASERLLREIAQVREKHPAARHGERGEWVHIRDYPLPAGRYNRERTQLLFLVPVGYPNTGPDCFFVDSDLRLADGSMPPGFNAGGDSSSGPSPLPGSWGWFSWHPQGWRPGAEIEKGDNLLTFLRGANACLRGEETV